MNTIRVKKSIKKDPVLDDHEYQRLYGDVCPYCRAKKSKEFFKTFARGSHAYQNVRCKECGMKWKDHFTLTGYKEITHED